MHLHFLMFKCNLFVIQISFFGFGILDNHFNEVHVYFIEIHDCTHKC
jgi:hypothetical protein